MSKSCPHQPSLGRDLMIVVILLLCALVLREGISWIFKTNPIQEQIGTVNHSLNRIIDALNRNGIQVSP